MCNSWRLFLCVGVIFPWIMWTNNRFLVSLEQCEIKAKVNIALSIIIKHRDYDEKGYLFVICAGVSRL